jgi:hypothetical protein
VFTTRQGIEGITDGKLTLGADASVAAGPVGRAASAGTDQTFTAEVYSYSRNRGLFAGVSLDGSIISIDSKSNRGLYGRSTTAADIIARKVSTDADSAKRFERAIQNSTGRSTVAGSTPGNATVVPDRASPAPADANAPPAGATTFPMEDAQPGAEPPK